MSCAAEGESRGVDVLAVGEADGETVEISAAEAEVSVPLGDAEIGLALARALDLTGPVSARSSLLSTAPAAVVAGSPGRDLGRA